MVEEQPPGKSDIHSDTTCVSTCGVADKGWLAKWVMGCLIMVLDCRSPVRTRFHPVANYLG